MPHDQHSAAIPTVWPSLSPSALLPLPSPSPPLPSLSPPPPLPWSERVPHPLQFSQDRVEVGSPWRLILPALQHQAVGRWWRTSRCRHAVPWSEPKYSVKTNAQVLFFLFYQWLSCRLFLYAYGYRACQPLGSNSCKAKVSTWLTHSKTFTLWAIKDM